MALSPGTIVGGYRVERVLGSGGMGTVYLAKHPQLPRMDALKVLSVDLTTNEEFRGRFEREANVVAGMDHPNIVAVHNRGEENGQLWIAMQYVEGTDASAELKRDPAAMSPLRALSIVTQIGRGLDYAHRRGLLHRDVKPANFLLSTVAGEDERALLADFGVAKSAEDTVELTQTGSFVATIAYAPPEQLSGQPLDHRADIYSLGCAFFKLLTGRNPYPATQPALVMMGHLHEPPPRATDVNPHLPAALDQVFAKVMAKQPADRFNSCREFTEAATAALVPGYNPVSTTTSPTYPIQVAPPGMLPRYGETHSGPAASASEPTEVSARPAKRTRVYLAIGAAVVAVALAVGIGIVASGGKHTDSAATTSANLPTSAGAADANLSPVDKARKDNPAFQGKTVTMVDVTGAQFNTKYSIYLAGSQQAAFLESLGFVYNSQYQPAGGETSPRPADGWGSLTVPDNSYIVAVRSDEKAGGGGLLGLPSEITSSRAIVIPLDDAAAVAAVRNWTPDSTQTLVNKLVPVLHTRVR
ncbi:serine/threonine protein kinase [Nocardia yunnanensis]|uniref:non-specific serine/threonine protein kinase n=1 Tax=Nocardia yunnanensis TaxID=2382165 RepID=A0A386ZGL1_9NOCA|nr:serine/threonine-protein kinase [Nocardia yunnanensis]AYF76637.1 serine/threonine protein kinase [Nocardia yunnanensis]